MSSEGNDPAVEPTGAAPEQNVLDADGRERPAFLLGFPKHPELDLLVQAFESGNFRYVRTHAERVAAAAQVDAVKKAAEELRRRIDPDPLVLKMLLCAVALFVFLVLWSYFGLA